MNGLADSFLQSVLIVIDVAHKKKLLDSKMVLTNENTMMELDVKLAAHWWLVSPGRNYGLVIDIEDSIGQRKPPSSFFRQRDCTSADGNSLI